MSVAIDFQSPIPEEKKKLLELKFTIYMDTNFDNEQKKQDWCAVFVDNKHKTTQISGRVEKNVNKLELELYCVLNCFQYLIDKFDNNVLQYVCLELFTTSVYVSNILKEWLNKWALEDFVQRPNSELLKQVHMMQNMFNKTMKVSFVPKNSNEYHVTCHQILESM